MCIKKSVSFPSLEETKHNKIVSTRIRMAFVMYILPLLFSVALVRSDQNMVPLKSFKISGNVTYDCIDIYKQPGLDHPLLINHTIQMKPSVSRHEIKNQTGKDDETYKKKITCPDGNVPILRNTKEITANAQLFAEKYLHPLSADSPGTHISGVRLYREGPYRGIESRFNAYNLNVGKDQASYSQIYVGSGLNNQVNFISAGLMINPSIFGDGRVWSYGFWKGKDGKGCYNTACPGFIQTSREVPIVEPRNLKPGEPTWLYGSIHQDQETGNWWFTIQRLNVRHEIDVNVGYWPKELFNLLGSGANMVGAGGVVQASRSGSSPPMGNGKFPNGGRMESALFANIQVRDYHYFPRGIDYYPFEKLLDSTKCYGLRLGKIKVFHQNPFGYFFNYGGPGGNSCGI